LKYGGRLFTLTKDEGRLELREVVNGQESDGPCAMVPNQADLTDREVVLRMAAEIARGVGARLGGKDKH